MQVHSIFIFLLFLSTKADRSSERSALLSLRSSVGRSLPWDLSISFCDWRGVTCVNGTVTELRLPGKRLRGPIPPGVLGNLTSLKILSLRVNALSGPLPSDISSCTLLSIINLRQNRFEGDLLPLLPLANLTSIDLSNNFFSGNIPPGLSSLSGLSTLFLQFNDLTGPLPDSFNLSRFNVSFNNITGSIPPSLQQFPATSFLNTSLCSRPLAPCESPPQAAPTPAPPLVVVDSGSHKLTGGQIAGIIIGCVLLLFFLIALVVCLRFCCSRKSSAVDEGKTYIPVPVTREDPKVSAKAGNVSSSVATTNPPVVVAAEQIGRANVLVFFRSEDETFDLEELLRASAEVLGKGTFGTTYKALLGEGKVVAVKRLREVQLLEKDFVDKMDAAGKMEHPNLVRLIAYYYSKDEKLLVYDYMPLGSLSGYLHGSRGSRQPMDWETRLNIAISAGRGVEHIHSTGQKALHGNIRSSNILFDQSTYARVSEHTIGQLARPSPISNRTKAYHAPEVTDSQHLSQKADVYSFGILLLELLTGKSLDDGVDLPLWVKSHEIEEWRVKVIDPEITTHLTVEDKMVELLQLGLECAVQFPDFRPSMSEVVAKIDKLYKVSMDRKGWPNSSAMPALRSLMD